VERYQPLLFQPDRSLVGCSLTSILEEMRATLFPELEGQEIEVRIAAEGPLAYVEREFMGPGRHLVVFHPVLNNPQTPIEVLRFIAKHELTHLVCPPRMLAGRIATHYPEFWVREAAVGPERHAVWAWVYRNFRRCARHTRLGYNVSRKWVALRESPRTPYTPSLPFNGERCWESICPEDGAQLQLPPDWPTRPLPFVMQVDELDLHWVHDRLDVPKAGALHATQREAERSVLGGLECAREAPGGGCRCGTIIVVDTSAANIWAGDSGSALGHYRSYPDLVKRASILGFSARHDPLIVIIEANAGRAVLWSGAPMGRNQHRMNIGMCVHG
jgi:hypothetical protein